MIRILANLFKHAPQFLRADVVFAVRYEGALHLEDVLVRRVRLDLEQRDRGLAAAPEILEIMRSSSTGMMRRSRANLRSTPNG